MEHYDPKPLPLIRPPPHNLFRPSLTSFLSLANNELHDPRFLDFPLWVPEALNLLLGFSWTSKTFTLKGPPKKDLWCDKYGKDKHTTAAESGHKFTELTSKYGFKVLAWIFSFIACRTSSTRLCSPNAPGGVINSLRDFIPRSRINME